MPSLRLFSRPLKNGSHYFLNTFPRAAVPQDNTNCSHTKPNRASAFTQWSCACSDVAPLLKRPLMWNRYRKQGQWDVWAKEATAAQNCGRTNWIYDFWLFLCSLFLTGKQLPITWLLPYWIIPTQRRACRGQGVPVSLLSKTRTKWALA